MKLVALTATILINLVEYDDKEKYYSQKYYEKRAK
jgi:hypothetical protein